MRRMQTKLCRPLSTEPHATAYISRLSLQLAAKQQVQGVCGMQLGCSCKHHGQHCLLTHVCMLAHALTLPSLLVCDALQA
jgi:hypothetical protein